MLKDKMINLMHKEEDLLRHSAEKLQDIEALKEEAMISMPLEEREKLALEREEKRESLDAQIEHKRELKKNSKHN